MNNKKLLEFKEATRKEYALYYIKGIKGPILERLQIHLNSLDNKDYEFSNLFVPKNMESELYLSILYQIVYPSKPTYKRLIKFEGEEIVGKSSSEKLFKVINILGVENIKKLPTGSKYLFQTDIKDTVRFKPIGEGYMFDITFKGVGASQGGEFFIKEVNKILPKVDLSIETQVEYKY